MGLTVQNLGVEGPRVLGVAPEKRGDRLALPSMLGWTWLTLRGVWDEDALAAEVVVAAAASGVRALAYSVDDSDSAYLVGATPTGLAFRLSVDGRSETREIERAARFASVPVARINDALARAYVFAEHGVHEVYAAMGLVAPARPAVPTMAIEPGEDEDDEHDDDEAAFVHAIRTSDGRRWAARAEIPFGGRWVVVAAEGHPSGGLAASFCARRDRIVIVGASRDIEELEAEITQEGSGVTLDAWQEIPAEIPRSLRATITWALNTVR